MIFKLSLQLLLTFCILGADFKADASDAECKLSASYIVKSNRNFALKSHLGNYELLLRDSVPAKETLYLTCNNTVSSISCDKKGKFKPNLPKGSTCSPPKATVTRDFHNTFCKHDNYQVGYNIAGSLLPLYSVCYNRGNLSAQYAIYDSYTNNLQTKRPAVDFTTDGVISGQDANSFKSSEIYQRFNMLLGSKQTFIKNPSSLIIARGHLAPSADFLFIQDMRATFKYLNVVPQFSAINNGNWKKIEQWVRSTPRKRPRDSHLHYRVVTGGYDVLELPHSSISGMLVPMYLEFGNRNPIPKWTFKVVDKLNSCTVFVTYNNIFDSTKPAPICTVIACPRELTLSDNMQKGYTYCCDAQTFKHAYLPYIKIC